MPTSEFPRLFRPQDSEPTTSATESSELALGGVLPSVPGRELEINSHTPLTPNARASIFSMEMPSVGAQECQLEYDRSEGVCIIERRSDGLVSVTVQEFSGVLPGNENVLVVDDQMWFKHSWRNARERSAEEQIIIPLPSIGAELPNEEVTTAASSDEHHDGVSPDNYRVAAAYVVVFHADGTPLLEQPAGLLEYQKSTLNRIDRALDRLSGQHSMAGAMDDPLPMRRMLAS